MGEEKDIAMKWEWWWERESVCEINKKMNNIWYDVENKNRMLGKL